MKGRRRSEKEPARSGERPEEFREGPVGLGDVRRASGADGETLEAIVMEAVREREGRRGRSRRRESTKSPPSGGGRPSSEERAPATWAESTVASDDDAGSAGDSPEARARWKHLSGGNTSLSKLHHRGPASAELTASSRPAAARGRRRVRRPPPRPSSRRRS